MGQDTFGCYWLVRQDNKWSCSQACSTFIATLLASPNDGNGSPVVNPLFLMCTDVKNSPDYTNAISVSGDGITLDPALAVFESSGSMSSLCNSKRGNVTCKFTSTDPLYLLSSIKLYSRKPTLD